MFHELWRIIVTAPDGRLHKAVADAANQYDDLILECSVIPEEGIQFLEQIFSCERVLRAKGIERFLLEINVDSCKYTPAQLERILAVLVRNTGIVSDALGRHSIGDFIARTYPGEIAYRTFLALSKGGDFEKHVAFVGLDVLRMRTESTSELYRKIEKKWREMQ